MLYIVFLVSGVFEIILCLLSRNLTFFYIYVACIFLALTSLIPTIQLKVPSYIFSSIPLMMATLSAIKGQLIYGDYINDYIFILIQILLIFTLIIIDLLPDKSPDKKSSGEFFLI